MKMWFDHCEEVVLSLVRNRLRTTLTALSVAWGVFMLVALLGVGSGIANNLAWRFRDDAVNSIWISPGQTSIPHDGFGVGRQLRLSDADYTVLDTSVSGVEHLAGRFRMRGEYTIRHQDKTAAYDIRSVHPEHQFIEKTIVLSGRFLNERDLDERRKVAVIGIKVSEYLFDGQDPVQAPLGEEIFIDNIPYTVIGVYEDVGGDREMNIVYIPLTTARLAYGGSDTIHQLMFTVGEASLEESLAIETEVRNRLANTHQFSPSDRRALRIRNNLESFAEVQQIFVWLNGFVWVVGLGTIAAGIIGVGNISLISVKERTKEIGLRKALGAPPRAIVGEIMRESIALTTISGYLGLLGGVLFVEALRSHLPENDYIRAPELAVVPALVAAALLVIAGAIAGYLPARHAARVPPVVALREDG